MVDKKYLKAYQQPIMYRVMMPDKWIFAEKYDSVVAAMSSATTLRQDFFVVETFPGFKIFPVYNENIE